MNYTAAEYPPPWLRAKGVRCGCLEYWQDKCRIEFRKVLLQAIYVHMDLAAAIARCNAAVQFAANKLVGEHMYTHLCRIRWSPWTGPMCRRLCTQHGVRRRSALQTSAQLQKVSPCLTICLPSDCQELSCMSEVLVCCPQRLKAHRCRCCHELQPGCGATYRGARHHCAHGLHPKR